MKHFLTILFLSCSTMLMGQYDKLIDENKQWVIRSDYWDQSQSPLPAEATYYFAYLNGDTVLSSTTYKKLFHQRFYLSTYYSGPTFPYVNDTLQQPQLVGFLREDTITQQVFMIQNGPGPLAPEDILFDFGLTVNDPFPHPLLPPTTIDSISQVVLLNNDTNKILFFDYFGQSVNNLPANYIIEGIGGPGGFINTFMLNYVSGYTIYTELLCYRKNGIQLFSSCNYPSFINSVHESFSTATIKVNPNPTSGQLTISLEEAGATTVNIRNSLGQLLLLEKHALSNQVELDLSTYPSGLYFLQVESDGQVITKKVVKE